MGVYAQYNPHKVRLHVVVLKAFSLGAVFMTSLVALFFKHNYASTITRLALYTLSNSIFYLLEFLSTAVYNNSETDDDSFILNDTDIHLVHIASLLEVLLEYFAGVPLSRFSLWAGIMVALIGQMCRTIAMYTAGTSFNHYIQRERTQQHVLVTHGIYNYLRHPSYFGFFWWFIGCQLLLQNTLTLFVGIWKLHAFFKTRIEFEEDLLVKFFGKDYDVYRAKTSVAIPFI